ncbi:MAG: ion channel [Polyangiaceae bacterium]
MNERALMTLGLLLGIGSGKPPNQWLSSLNAYVREKQAKEPMNATLVTVLLGTLAFYRAEREHNPKVNSIYDALVYVSTNLSVGYSDIFAKTEAGKAIGSALMTYGPALAARTFDPPEQRDAGFGAQGQQLAQIADKLEQILGELRAARGA